MMKMMKELYKRIYLTEKIDNLHYVTTKKVWVTAVVTHSGENVLDGITEKASSAA